MPAVITTRSKVDISRVTRLFGHSEAHPAVVDKTLTDRQIKVLPVRISGQVKPLIYSVSRCYPPPAMCVLSRQYVTAETLTRHEPMSGREYLPFVRPKARFAGQKAQEHSFVRRNAVFTGHIAMYRWRHFRQSRLCHHDLHKPLWQADITDGGPQGVSVTPDAIGMRSETTTHGRVWRIAPPQHKADA